MKKLFLIGLLCSSKLFALDGNSPLHFTISGAMTGTGYVILSHALGRSHEARVFALIAASGASLGVGLMKELMDTEYTKGQWTKYNTEDMVVDAAGVVLTATAIYFLDIHNMDKSQSLSFSGNKITYALRW